MRIFPILAVTVALGACEPAAESQASSPGASQTADADALPATDDGPDAFVHNIYASMASDGPAPLGEESLWSNAAWADMRRYLAVAPEGFNADPLCNCQDPMGLAIRDLAVTAAGVDRADAAVTLTQGEAQTAMVLKLVRENDAWRIDDIVREGDPTFRADLAQWTRDARAAG